MNASTAIQKIKQFNRDHQVRAMLARDVESLNLRKGMTGYVRIHILDEAFTFLFDDLAYPNVKFPLKDIVLFAIHDINYYPSHD
jgi:hypothetical protein